MNFYKPLLIYLTPMYIENSKNSKKVKLMKKRFNKKIMIFILFLIFCFPVYPNNTDISPKNEKFIEKTPSNINGLRKKVVNDGFEDITQSSFPPQSSSFDPF